MAKMIADYPAIEKFSRDLKKLSAELMDRKKDADRDIQELNQTYQDITFRDFKQKYDDGMKRVPLLCKDMEEYSQALKVLAGKVKKHLDTKFRK